MKNGDKPTYPICWEKEENNPSNWQNGLTKKEYFAGLAMQGLLANPQYWKRVYKTLSTMKANKDSIECVFAQFSINLADELLEQLESSNTKNQDDRN